MNARLGSTKPVATSIRRPSCSCTSAQRSLGMFILAGQRRRNCQRAIRACCTVVAMVRSTSAPRFPCRIPWLVAPSFERVALRLVSGPCALGSHSGRAHAPTRRRTRPSAATRTCSERLATTWTAPRCFPRFYRFGIRLGPHLRSPPRPSVAGTFASSSTRDDLGGAIQRLVKTPWTRFVASASVCTAAGSTFDPCSSRSCPHRRAPWTCAERPPLRRPRRHVRGMRARCDARGGDGGPRQGSTDAIKRTRKGARRRRGLANEWPTARPRFRSTHERDGPCVASRCDRRLDSQSVDPGWMRLEKGCDERVAGTKVCTGGGCIPAGERVRGRILLDQGTDPPPCLYSTNSSMRNGQAPDGS